MEIKMELFFDSKKDARIVYEAMRPEVISAPSNKTKVNLNLRKNNITIEIKSDDAASFRAAVNACSRWIVASKSVMEV